MVDWLAYPDYSLQDDLTSFILAPDLYYTSRCAGICLIVPPDPDPDPDP